MPKKNGVMKTYSFDKKTIEQMQYLSEVLFLKNTALLEFLINKAYNQVKKDNETKYDDGKRDKTAQEKQQKPSRKHKAIWVCPSA